MEEAGAWPIPGRGLEVSRTKNGGYVCSTVSESERLGGADWSPLREMKDRFLGGKGGADLDFGGANSRLINGAACSDTSVRRDGGGRRFGPSSIIQSLRSTSDVLRPRLGGDGDGECEYVLYGTIVDNVFAVGESGSSRIFRGSERNDSKACIRDCIAVDGMAGDKFAFGNAKIKQHV